MAIYKLDILAKEIKEELPHWLDPSQKGDKDSPERQAIRDKHRAKWEAERDAKREKKYWAWLIVRADALGLRLRDNPSVTDIAEAERFLGIKDWDESKHPRDDRGRFGSGGGGADEDEGAGKGVSEEGVDKYGLSAKDRAQVYDWMGDGYRQMRSDPEFGKVVEKMPKVTGQFWRGTRMTQETFTQYQTGVGRVTKLEKFSSSSSRIEDAKEFMGGSRHEDTYKAVPVLFAFRGSGHKIPKPLAEVAGSGDENEVILKMGNKFKIEDVKPVKDDEYGEYYQITMAAAA